MASNENKNEKTVKSNLWLQKLKEESWEAELIISTVAIFGTVQLFSLISWMVDWFIDILPPSQYFTGYMVSSFGLLAVSILVTMFIIHFLMRAYWVGLVGLNSVFPDYSLEDSAYSEIYTSKMLAILPKLKDTIPKVDDLCSVIFSAAFFLFFMYAYFTIVAIIFLLIYINFGYLLPSIVFTILKWIIYGLSFLTLAFSVLANLKRFKNNKSVQSFYFNSVKWGSMIMMGPLYKFILQISMSFATNYKKKKALIGINITFLIFGVLVTFTQVFTKNVLYLINFDSAYNESKIYNHYYRSSYQGDDFLLGPQINSEVIHEPFVKLFIPVYSYESKIASKMYGEVKRDEALDKKESRAKRRRDYLERYAKYHTVKIDTIDIPIFCKRYDLPGSNQYGVLAFIDLAGYPRGNHTLYIRKNLGEESKEWEIPFYYY